MRDYEITSDLKQSKFENLKFVQGDTGSKIIVNLFEDSQSVNLTDCTVLAKYKRADGYTDNKEATVADNTITVEIDNTMTATAGVLKLVFEITYETTKKVSTFMLLADIAEGIGSKSTTGGGTGDVVIDVDLSNYYTKKEIDTKLDKIANELKLVAGDNNTIKLMLGTKELSSITISGGTVEPNPITYSITNILSNCSNSNTATSIEENTSYNATISANEGYRLKTVTVTMGGIDITSDCYSNGTINIASVTGDIVITVETEVYIDTVVGSIDENKDISLTGLNAGTYTLKYEDSNGNVLNDFDTVAIMEVV